MLLIATTLLARLVFASALGLGIDESYMVAAGRTLRLGYFDHPPAGWWLAWASSQLFGSEAAVVVRLPFIALFGLSTWLMFRLTSDLFGACAGLWAAAMFNAAPVFGIAVGCWVLPDGPLIVALLAATISLRRATYATDRAAWGWWIGSGLCAGLALFSKYTAALSIAGVLLFLLTQPAARGWLRRPQPYVAGLLALLVFSPVLAWNAAHGWVSLLFQLGRAGGGRLHPFGALSTLAGEAIFLLPWIWLPLIGLGITAARRGWRDRDCWLLVCMAMPPIVLFLVVSIHSHVMFHWAAPGYLVLFPLLGEAIGRVRRTSRFTRAYLVTTATLVCFGVVLVGTEVRYNWLPGFIEDFAPGADPDLDAVDWTSLQVDLGKRGLLDPAKFVIAATRWHDAGKVDYALNGPTVICLGDDPREYGLIAPSEQFRGRDVLIVAPRTSIAQISDRFAAWFDRVEPIEPATVRHSGRAGMVLPLFIGRNLHPPP